MTNLTTDQNVDCWGCSSPSTCEREGCIIKAQPRDPRCGNKFIVDGDEYMCSFKAGHSGGCGRVDLLASKTRVTDKLESLLDDQETGRIIRLVLSEALDEINRLLPMEQVLARACARQGELMVELSDAKREKERLRHDLEKAIDGRNGEAREVERLRGTLTICDNLISEKNRVLDVIPRCKTHGSQCVPHAIEWVEEQLTARETFDPSSEINSVEYQRGWQAGYATALEHKDKIIQALSPEKTGDRHG